MNWYELYLHLRQLYEDDDDRLNDDVLLYNKTTGEFTPLDTVEFDDGEDPEIPPNRLFLTTPDE